MLSPKVELLKTQLKQAKDNDLVTKERDKLRLKVRNLAEDHKVALEAAATGTGSYEVYHRWPCVRALRKPCTLHTSLPLLGCSPHPFLQESKRLVDVSGELLAAKQSAEALRRAHADLLADCAEVGVRVMGCVMCWLLVM